MKLLKALGITIIYLLSGVYSSWAAIEDYSYEKKGLLTIGQQVTWKEEKFNNPSVAWSSMYHHSVKNRLFLRISENEPISASFSCKVTVDISYLSSPDQTVATTISGVELNVNYIKGVGASYRMEDSYHFTNAHEITTTITQIQSPEYGAQVPVNMILGTQIVVERQYIQAVDASVNLDASFIVGAENHQQTAKINWSSSGNLTPDEYDLEWMFVDAGSEAASSIADMINLGYDNTFTVINELFRNNAGRITSDKNNYDLPLIANSKYLVLRIRPVNYDLTNGLRIEGKWNYKLDNHFDPQEQYAIWDIESYWHEDKLNWQYQASFAEEGKRKDVISYFDGTLRSRQTVTLNNADHNAIVQENIYDDFGRQTATILPAPVLTTSEADKQLKYFGAFNKNSADSSYQASNLNLDDCDAAPDVLSNIFGAAKYYSSNNLLMNQAEQAYNKYIPDAGGFPISINRYTPDHTGRMSIQGGVGATFQPGNGANNKLTTYAYAKPEQWELDRIFGSDAGYADRYLKNMVKDPNGTISISYLNSAGQTIATALTGTEPTNLSALPGKPAPVSKTSTILDDKQFKFDESSLRIIGTTTYVSSIVGIGKVDYEVEQLVSKYQKQGTSFSTQHNAYYKLFIEIKDDCGNVLFENTGSPVTVGSAALSPLNTVNLTGLPISNLSLAQGTYYFTFTLAMDKEVMEQFADDYILKGQADGAVKRVYAVVKPYLEQLQLADCYQDCTTCGQLLGEKFEFLAQNTEELKSLGLDVHTFTVSEKADFDALIESKYDLLKAQCTALEAACGSLQSNNYSPCQNLKEQMLADVSPGGQYALYGKNYVPMERSINVYAKLINNLPVWRIVFPINGAAPGSEFYIKNSITLDNGTVTTPYASGFNVSMLIKYWKPEWNLLFLPYHPEYCKLEQCEGSLNTFLKWDKHLEDRIKVSNISTISASYSSSGDGWLADADPFFDEFPNYLSEMQQKLSNYSRDVLKFPLQIQVNGINQNLNNKGISGYIDYELYCKSLDGNLNYLTWNNCNVDNSCRVTEREWALYKRIYLEVKKQFYDQLYEELCPNTCSIGVPLTALPEPAAIGCLPITDFLIEKMESLPAGVTCNQQLFKVRYLGNQTGSKYVNLFIPSIYAYTDSRSFLMNLADKELYICLPNDIPLEQVEIQSVCADPIPNYKALIASNTWRNARTGQQISFNPVTNLVHVYGLGTGPWEFDTDDNTLYFGNRGYGLKHVNQNTLILSYTDDELGYVEDEYISEDFSSNNTKRIYGYIFDDGNHNNLYLEDRNRGGYTIYREISDLQDEFYSSRVSYPNFVTINRYQTRSISNVQVYQEDEQEQGTNTWSSGGFDAIGFRNPNGITAFLVKPSMGFVFKSTSSYYALIIKLYVNGVLADTKQVIVSSESGIGTFTTNLLSWDTQFYLTITPSIAASQQPPYDNIDCSPLYAKKKPVFSKIGTEVSLSQGALASLGSNIQLQAQQEAQEQLSEQIDAFISKLSPQPGDIASLKNNLLTIGLAAFGASHPNGASSTAAATGGVNSSNSMVEALRATAAGQVFTPSYNFWVSGMPYPYAKQPQFTVRSIDRVSTDLSNRITTLRQALGNPASVQDFYLALKATFGNAMTLNLAELTDLVDAQVNCNHILEYDIELPVFLEASGYQTPAAYQAAKAAFSSAIPGIAPGNLAADTQQEFDKQENYEEVFSNFMNHYFGYTLSYQAYMQYEQLLQTQANAYLINKRPFDPVYPDMRACLRTYAAPLVGNGLEEYRLMIAEERKAFIAAYIKNCAAPYIQVSLTSEQQIYHYTLYYYDQAGNLIRTVPPAGVQVLTDSQVQQVALNRSNKMPNCNYSGPMDAANLSSSKNSLQQVLQGGAGAVELWMYEQGFNGGQTLIKVNEHYLLNFCMASGKLSAELYKLDPASTTGLSISASYFYTSNITDLQQWNHIVLQGSQFSQQQNMQLWFNGRMLNPSNQAGVCNWQLAGNPLVYSESVAHLKHLRTYNRLLAAAEIRTNAANGCLMPQQNNYLVWHRYNIPAAGSVTTVGNTTAETPFKAFYPQHQLITSYAYNSLNQVVKQQTPDAGSSLFWYNVQGQMVASQNAKQVALNKYSYTEYDDKARIKEVGQKTYSTLLAQESHFLPLATLTAFYAGTQKEEITQTIYDEAPVGFSAGILENLRNRVSASIYKENNNAATDQINRTYYSYDLAGNVSQLYQSIGSFGVKRILYEYDQISGKVNFVAYQPGLADQFYYQYKYDAENRLTEVWSAKEAKFRKTYGFGSKLTSVDEMQRDARYRYYLHGPLARLELGTAHGKLQGIDYAYTLQGWLKGVNSQELIVSDDIGQDGSEASKDAFGYSLGYYLGDYKAISTTVTGGFKRGLDGTTPSITGKNLYNGNISHSTYAIAKINSGDIVGYSYAYDELNRLKLMRQHDIAGFTGNWNGQSVNNHYSEDFSYDGNGNILSLQRRNGSGVLMDDLNYSYNYQNSYLQNNKLRHVKDIISGSTGSYDLADQIDDNYAYDAIGNLTSDQQSGINAISWNVYGKIKSIDKTGTAADISYAYDAAGNRVKKTVGTTQTYYIRDAQGNTLAVYEQSGSTTLWKEQQLYGSSRLGIWKPELNLASGTATLAWQQVGNKFFELSNHLGNVLSVISNKRHQSAGNTFEADVVSAQDYYAFGSHQPGRSYTAANSGYRYGFNGKENDNEVKGEGNQQDYGMRIYDTRLGRFLSVDPLGGNYPWYTPYQFAGNMPIAFIDLDGLEEVAPVIHYNPYTQTGSASYPVLSKSQWKQSDRSSASGTFASAASYNTQTLNSSVYKPVNQIHKYYVWAAREIDKTKSNIKFFHAAADVTAVSSVGGAFGNPFINDRVQESLAGVNKKLLDINIGVVKEILNTGRSNSVGGSGQGVDFDIRYVLHEQRTLTQYLSENPLSSYDQGVINRLLATGSALEAVSGGGHFSMAKLLSGTSSLDYSVEKQRFAIGHSLTFLKHLEAGDFKKNKADLNTYYNFFESFYGSENASEFKEYVKDNYSNQLPK